MKKAAVAVGGLVLGAAVALSAEPLGWAAGLSLQAVWALAVLATCIVWWVGALLPEFVTALIMAVAFIAFCGVPTETAFSAFASSTWWLLVAAFALGFGMQRCGLMARMAAAILRVFPRTFKMQAAGLIATGTLVGPFIPSLSAKATMLAPLALGISDSLGYERQGKQATGLFLAMFTGIRTVGPAVISSSIIGYGLLATLPSDVAAEFNMVHWFLCMLPWFVFVMVANYVAIVLLYAPRKATKKVPNADQDDRDRTPLSRAERRMAVVMVVCVALWVTEPLHAVPSHVVALAAMVAMIALQVVSAKEVCQGLAWGSLIFIGCVLGLANVFADLGIDAWIVGSCAPAFTVLAQSAYLLIAGICLITVALRFVIVSEMAYINIFMAFMVPLVVQSGVSPWVIGVSVYAVVNPWFVLYQNPIYLSAYYATEGKMACQSTSAAYCALYLVICTCGLLVSVPFWQTLGLL